MIIIPWESMSFNKRQMLVHSVSKFVSGNRFYFLSQVIFYNHYLEKFLNDFLLKKYEI